MSFYSNFSDYYNFIFPFRTPVFTFLSDNSFHNHPVLDIGCGIGHYAGEFGKKGYEAIGIDLDAEMIRVAKTSHSTSDFFVMNMLDIGDLNADFGLIFSTGNVIAHLGLEHLEKFVRTVYTKLLSGGRWVFQVLNFDFLLTQSSYTFPDIIADNGRIVFHRHYPHLLSSGTPFQTELKENGRTIFKDEVMLYPQPSEVYIDIHKAVGFHFVDQFADFFKKPFDGQTMSANILIFSK